MKRYLLSQRDPFGNRITSPAFWVTAAGGALILNLVLRVAA